MLSIIKSYVLVLVALLITLSPQTVIAATENTDKPSTVLGSAMNTVFYACKSPNGNKFSIWLENNNNDLRFNDVYLKQATDPDKTGLTGTFITKGVRPNYTHRSGYIPKSDWQGSSDYIFRMTVTDLQSRESSVMRVGFTPRTEINVDSFPICFWNDTTMLFRENLITFRACASPDDSAFKLLMFSRHNASTTIENMSLISSDRSHTVIPGSVQSFKVFKSNYIDSTQFDGYGLLVQADVNDSESGDSYQARMGGRTTTPIDVSSLPTCYNRLDQ